MAHGYYDVLVVGGFVLASVAQQASVSGSLSSSRMFWYGVLLGLLALFLPPLGKAVAFVIALIASGLVPLLGKARVSGSVPLLLVVAIAVLVGSVFRADARAQAAGRI